MRLSGVMDADQGVAVAAFVSEGQVERQRRPAVALTDDERGGRQHSWQRLRQLAPEALRQAIWRVEKDEIVVASLPRCGAEEPQSVRAAHFGLAADRLEVGPHRRHGGRRGVHERRLRRAARERLEPERAGAGEQVEYARALDRAAEDREQRLAHAVRRGADRGAARGGQTPAAPAAGDDPHFFRRSVAKMPAWSEGYRPPTCLVPTMPDLTALIFGRTSTWSIHVSRRSAVEWRSSAKQHVLRFGSGLRKPASIAL